MSKNGRKYIPPMETPRSIVVFRWLGRLSGLGVVILVAAGLIRFAAPHWWLQILIGAWSLPFAALGIALGRAAVDWLLHLFRAVDHFGNDPLDPKIEDEFDSEIDSLSRR